jgi:hypothetical protein
LSAILSCLLADILSWNESELRCGVVIIPFRA